MKAQGSELKLPFKLEFEFGTCQDHAKWIPVATVSFQYMPEITINRALMDTLTEEQKEDWVKATPNPVFRYNNITKQVLLCPYQNLLGKFKVAEADFCFLESVQSSGQNPFQRMYFSATSTQQVLLLSPPGLSV